MANIPLDHQGYPVLITLNNGNFGSGFYLATKDTGWLITAKHVVSDERHVLRSTGAVLTSLSKNPLEAKNRIVLSEEAFANGRVMLHPTADVAAIRLAEVTDWDAGSMKHHLMALPGVNMSGTAPSGTVAVDPWRAISLMKDIEVADEVHLYGYPVSLHLSESPQFDHERPLLRRGIVAGLNYPQSTIILDCPVYPGNSGGPVVRIVPAGYGSMSHHYVIGLVSQFIPYAQHWVNQQTGIVHSEHANSGYSVIVAMDAVMDLLGIQPESLPPLPRPVVPLPPFEH